MGVRLSITAFKSYRIAIQSISAVVRVNYTNPLVRATIRTFPKWYVKIQHKYVSQQSYMAYHRISICNRYGTRVLKILDRNMAMQTATLRSTESNGKSTKGKATPQAMPQAFFQKISVFQKFSPRRCLRLRLRANKICILPLGYAKGDFLHNI
ncbi:hypothetical protein T01_3105 [Trichinella spiralis]|uniref:Uncharacterized protein n=1 Tax=Trichinella spiralis TaxID=6334 RepID=A0A0V1BVW5_TRISP|nr:hypothetical protein T01_3105 [Trichinella spiralis]